MRNPRRSGTRPDFYQLETFLTVAETRSFADAARRLGVSQPAISQSIARLEELLGGDLFERRRGSPVTLTAIGRAILPSARTLLYTIDQQMSRAVAIAQSRSGTLTVGFYPGIVSGPLHKGIADFVARRPDVQIRLVEAPPRDLHRHLNERTVDIIFVALLPDIASPMLHQERLWDEGLVVAMGADHPLATKGTLNWSEVCGLPLILRSNNGDLSPYQAILARVGDRALDCELHDVSRGALLEMVRMGIGATISFGCAVVPRTGVALLPIVDDKAFGTVKAVWPQADRNPLRHNLLACVRKHATNHRAGTPSVP